MTAAETTPVRYRKRYERIEAKLKVRIFVCYFVLSEPWDGLGST
jgi:hypothetical protein